MPRNSAGVYSLPVASYVSGTTIKSADMNSNLSDIGTALTQSVATTGVSTMTGPLIAFAGTLAAPGITWAGDTGTGFFLAGSHQIGLATNATLLATFNSDQSVTWKGSQTFQGAANTFSNVATFNGAVNQNANWTFGAFLIKGGGGAFDSSTVFIGSGASHSIGTVPDPGAVAGTTRFLREDSTWKVPTFTLPTTQQLTAGTTTYTPAAGVLKARVRMCGPGGGGGGATANNGSNGSAATSFGAWTANVGNGGAASAGAGGAGGTGGSNGTGNLVLRIPGGAGQGGQAGNNVNSVVSGGQGGANLFMGAGNSGANVTGGAGAANTGAGGGGGGATAGSTNSGAGGGAGEYVEFWVNAPATTTVVVGTGGGAGGAGGNAGGAGSNGVIYVEEFYF